MTSQPTNATTDTVADLPWVLAGPMLRQCSPDRLVIWLALREKARIKLGLQSAGEKLYERVFTPEKAEELGDPEARWLSASPNLHYVLLDLAFAPNLPTDAWIEYALSMQSIAGHSNEWIALEDCVPGICHVGHRHPGFMLPSRVRSVLHGSCRKPHHDSPDGLATADAWLAATLATHNLADQDDTNGSLCRSWPSALVMTGDQVYADDVAGPLLHAIHQVIEVLDLPDESLPSPEATSICCASDLYRHQAGFYARQTLLPSKVHHHDLIEVLFGGVEKPVFTTDNAHNHLITLAETLVMYLLVWSPALWRFVKWDMPAQIGSQDKERFLAEQAPLENFVQSLPAAQRLFAHVPTAMIFDDHDISDDWNLSREWEEVAYGHPFSKRVIGNALMAYMVNQGWGNRPEAFSGSLLDSVQRSLDAPGTSVHDAAIESLLAFRQWHYTWPTSPPLVVIDTRTHRWRSESAARKPSGLMDWEALTDLQQTLKGLPAVLLVSPTPVFGVKLIEVIQRVFTWFGKPLVVDAENWMAHPGTAHAMVNIFHHPKTPQHFVVLSGDVHYSFVYDVELRRHAKGPNIWQICSSGLRNTFPDRLLRWLDLANRWLYSPRSPLNWFTRRRRMRVIPRKPEGIAHGRRLLNGSGIGLVELDQDGAPVQISQILATTNLVSFTRRESESHWG